MISLWLDVIGVKIGSIYVPLIKRNSFVDYPIESTNSRALSEWIQIGYTNDD